MNNKSFKIMTAFLTLFFASAALLIFKHINTERLVNSDILYPEFLYLDIFISPFKLAGWQVVRAPAFFPDWPLYFFSRWVSGEFLKAHAIYMSLLLVWYMLYFRSFIKFFYKDSLNGQQIYYYCLAFGGLIVFPLSFRSFLFNYTDTPLLDPTNHQSPLLLGFPIIMMWLGLLNGKAVKIKDYILSFILALVGTASDLWFIIHIVFPLTLSVLITWKVRKPASKLPEFKLAIAIYTGTFIGYLIPYILSYNNILMLPFAQVGQSFVNIKVFINTYFDQIKIMWQSFRTGFQENTFYGLFVLGAVVLVILYFKNSYKNRSKSGLSLPLFGFHLFFVLNTVVVVNLIALNGMWVGIGNLRYMIPLFVLAFFVIGYWTVKYVIENKIFKQFSYFVFYGCCFFLAMAPLKWPVSIPKSRYLSANECLDSLAKEHNLKYGLGEYWEAKYFTFLSKNNLFINQINYYFEPLYWINNYQWYLNPQNNQLFEYDFLVLATQGESYKRVNETVGAPNIDINCSGYQVLIYKDEKLKHLNDVLRPKFQKFIDEMKAGDSRPFWKYVLNIKDKIPAQ